MKIVSVTNDYFSYIGSQDPEFMQKRGRPCLLVLRLRFRGVKRDFAVPFRSNIGPNVPKNQYFPLPPRKTTKPGHRHGIHYIKMFPIEKRYLSRFRTEGNPFYQTILKRLSANEKRIVSECQAYLDRYEKYGRPQFAVDIDRLIALMEP